MNVINIGIMLKICTVTMGVAAKKYKPLMLLDVGDDEEPVIGKDRQISF